MICFHESREVGGEPSPISTRKLTATSLGGWKTGSHDSISDGDCAKIMQEQVQVVQKQSAYFPSLLQLPSFSQSTATFAACTITSITVVHLHPACHVQTQQLRPIFFWRSWALTISIHPPLNQTVNSVTFFLIFGLINLIALSSKSHSCRPIFSLSKMKMSAHDQFPSSL